MAKHRCTVPETLELCFVDPEELERSEVSVELESRGHKQVYWVESDPHPDRVTQIEILE